MGGKVLEGIRVIDWTMVAAGPATSLWLGEFGADIVKIEQAGRGDIDRYRVSMWGVPTTTRGGMACSFEQFNVNKRSLTVDLRNEKAREIMYRLVNKSDVFLTNQLPDTIEKLGMDYEVLSKINPRLIYATNTIQGPKGPDRLTPGYDPLTQARTGIYATNGTRGQPPSLIPVGMADMVSALSSAFGIMLALFCRERTGVGQWVQTSQLQTAVNVMMAIVMGIYLLKTDDERKADPYGGIVRAPSRDDNLNPLTFDYRCKDGKWIFLSAYLETQWPPIARAINRPELIDDPRFVDLEKREKNRNELMHILQEVFAERTSDEWKTRFRETGGVPFSLVNTIDSVASDEQVLANDYLVKFDHPVMGQVLMTGMPCTLTKTPGTIRTPAPVLGQHTEEILLELGYSWEEIDELHRVKAI